MSYAPLKARLIHEIGTKAWLRTYWDDYEIGYKPKNTCPNSYGKSKPGTHDARVFLSKSPTLEDWDLGGKTEDYSDERWPKKCDHCGALVPTPQYRNFDGSGLEVTRHILHKRLYNSASGEPEPGDLFWASWYHASKEKCFFWSNCASSHLMAILPNGSHWDIDSRAGNCTAPDDRLHRCWIKRGEAPEVTVSKDGYSCSAGAGSIASGDYHGFLQNGIFSAG